MSPSRPWRPILTDLRAGLVAALLSPALLACGDDGRATADAATDTAADTVTDAVPDTGRADGATCPAGALGCACLGSGACDGGLACGPDHRCVDPGCEPGLLGCTCDGGQCRAGAVCDASAGTCRAPLGCAEAGCAPEQRCREAVAGADAACLPECDGGRVWNAEARRCDAVGTSCSADPEDPTSILAECDARLERCVVTDGAASCSGCKEFARPDGAGCVPVLACADLACGPEHRRCTPETATADATCGACVDGFTEQGGVCRAVAARRLTCADLACDATESCYEGRAGGDAYCQARKCQNPDEAWDPVLGTCVDCTLDIAFCGLGGETGKYWATTTLGGACLCETTTGWYADLGNAGTARPCDADGDGWARLPAKSAIESADAALADNARCLVRTIDRFVLRNEWGETRDLLTCDSGLEVGPRCPGAAAPVGLYESQRLDDEPEIAAAREQFPAYRQGGLGRALRAEELNPLTKACVSVSADHNDNAIADVNEHQADDVAGELGIFTRVGYFVELHRGYFLPAPVVAGSTTGAVAGAEQPGRYVIEERSRCGAFPLGYGDADGAGDYWRECTRNRDAGWAPDVDGFAPVGFDFARWSCDDASDQSGTCPTPPPPAPPSDGASISPHGLCEDGVAPSSDGYWRGMDHHAQFKCVQVAAQAGDPLTAPQVVTPDALYTDQADQALWLNRCRVACAPGDPACAADCDAAGCDASATDGDANPASPVVTCTPVLGASAVVGEVGFAAVRYQNSPGAYQRGCIDEWAPGPDPALNARWAELCPSFGGTESRSSDPLDHGALACCTGCAAGEYCGPGTECAPCPSKCDITNQCGVASQDGCGDPCACKDGDFCTDPDDVGSCEPWPDGDRCIEPLSLTFDGDRVGRLDDLDVGAFHDNFSDYVVQLGDGRPDICAETVDGLHEAVLGATLVGSGSPDFFVLAGNLGRLARVRLPGYAGGGRVVATGGEVDPATLLGTFCLGAGEKGACDDRAITAETAAAGIDVWLGGMEPLVPSVSSTLLWFEGLSGASGPLDVVVASPLLQPPLVSCYSARSVGSQSLFAAGRRVVSGNTSAHGDWGRVMGSLASGLAGTGLGVADDFWTLGSDCHLGSTVADIDCPNNSAAGIWRVALDAGSAPDLVYVVPDDSCWRDREHLVTTAGVATAVCDRTTGMGCQVGADGKLGFRASLSDGLLVVDGTTPASAGGYNLSMVPAYSCLDPQGVAAAPETIGQLTHVDPSGAASSRIHPGLAAASVCGGFSDRLVFHDFKPTVSGGYRFLDGRTFNPSVSYEFIDTIVVASDCQATTVIAASGPLTYPNCVARLNTDVSPTSVSVELQAGVTYHIGIGIRGADPRGSYSLRIQPP